MADEIVRLEYKYLKDTKGDSISNIELKWSEIVKEILLHVSLASSKEEEFFNLGYVNDKISKYITKVIIEKKPLQQYVRESVDVVLIDESIYKITRYLVKNGLVKGYYNEKKEKVFIITEKGIDFLDNLILE